MINYKTLVAASLMSMSLTSYASAQCVDCAIYPDRDALNKNEQTPAGSMGLTRPGGAAGSPNAANPSATNPSSTNNANNARAEYRDRSARRSGRGSSSDSARAKRYLSPDSRDR